MRRGRMPRWELWLDAFVVGFLLGIGVLVAVMPVLWMMEVI